MQFNAIVHAPVLRAGARLNIAEADQTEQAAPHRIAAGDGVALRFGVCCPALSAGRIAEHRMQPERAILTIGDRSWTLLRNDSGGIKVPGLVSEEWVVAEPEAALPA